MKTKLTILLIASLGLATLLISGCNSIDSAGYNKIPTEHPAVTNSVMVMETNSVINPVTGKTEITVTPHEKVTVKPAYITYELEEKPMITGGLNIVKSLPIPYAAIAGSLLAAIYGLYGRLRNGQALKAVVLGVDSAREIMQSTPQGRQIDSMLKDQLIKHQEAAGVLHVVSGVVNNYTGDTVKPVALTVPTA